MSDRVLHRAFARHLGAAGLDGAPGDASVVTEAELDGLPEAVQRYLRFMDVVGRPRTWSFAVDFRGRFKMRPDGPWMPAAARQRNTVAPITRVFSMVLRLGGVVPMVGRDTYLQGRGRMLGKLVGVVTVADAEGEELDLGELSTWLNDVVLLAPSMLLGAPVTFAAVGDDSFEVGLADHGREVRALVTLDERGAPRDHSTTDRWATMPDGLVRARWHTPVPGWTTGPDGRPFPEPGCATWELEGGPFTYVEGGFVPATLRTNLTPDEASRPVG